ncbi:hypothetical protein EAG_15201 [Camponotus floridanus]|uniref:Uncharacterized protein n=2 Tax=Camponotus floridanus TaxID=104421 RepID=E2ATM0_CAMFO|nr:uncharacterized protein LOC105255895 isoform X2 [Camponotus floridanus]XP_025270540.1 uncharacterized protein LOC105255895 isoform X2 [Camponotus floridanus]EFN63216.1 hypothetical protein EAG_15201 [Camponotus floridanus]
MTPTGALYLLLTILTILDGSKCNTRYFVKMRTNASDMFKTKAENLRILQDPIAITPNSLYDNEENEHQVEDERMTKEISNDQFNRRNSFVETSTFNPDVLNKFLEEYANKIKSTTEKSFKYPFRIVKPPAEPLVLEIDNETVETTTSEEDEKFDQNSSTISEENDALSEALNDTVKRNKYYGTNTYEDRNGWVTLEAIPWSKSKISKWQANPSTQRPWPEIKPWDKPSMKPWASDYTIRPTYENNKPWYDKSKPNWSDNNENPYQKPISRPSYHSGDVAQKWPSEKPYWNKHETHRPNSDIITDDRPANFPNTWSRPQTTSYQLIDKYTEKDQSGDGSEWHDYSSKYDQNRPTIITERPNFSHYQYVNNHPPNHPASGDGQWILLSTNRGYSKSRQRSIKIDTVNTPEALQAVNTTNRGNKQNRPALPVITSKRQVRLTVLPSINGTNTTTSHGGLLEVEKTFKSVDQSRKEYEMGKLTTEPSIPNKRPIRHTLSGQPSSSAVLAAVGAGMLPATMAMMIPMMLGRRKRDLRLMNGFSKSYDLQMNLRKLAREYNTQERRPIGL